MKFNLVLFKKDIRQAVPVILLVAALIATANFILGKICPWRMIFGLPCPGCGLTRAFLLVLQGKLYEATVIHPFWIPLVILLLAFLAVRYFVIDNIILKRAMNVLKVCAIIMIILGVIYYIYRMIMWYPDKAPMVYDEKNIIRKIIKILG